MWRLGSTQRTHVHLDSIVDDVVWLDGGRCCAILEVDGLPLHLLSEADQEAILASFATFLNSLSAPIQILVRGAVVDLEPYAQELDGRSNGALTGRLVTLAREHAAYLRQRGRKGTLLERRQYIIVPAGGDPVPSFLSRIAGRPRLPEDRRSLRTTLDARCARVAEGLQHCRLTARRLGDVELATLFSSCWCPGRPRWRRLDILLAEARHLVPSSNPNGRSA